MAVIATESSRLLTKNFAGKLQPTETAVLGKVPASAATSQARFKHPETGRAGSANDISSSLNPDKVVIPLKPAKPNAEPRASAALGLDVSWTRQSSGFFHDHPRTAPQPRRRRARAQAFSGFASIRGQLPLGFCCFFPPLSS